MEEKVISMTSVFFYAFVTMLRNKMKSISKTLDERFEFSDDVKDELEAMQTFMTQEEYQIFMEEYFDGR